MKKYILLSAFIVSSALAGNDLEKQNKAIEKSNMDLNVRPQDDFYKYVNGNWLKNNPVPPTESRWGSFSNVQENNQKNLKTILEEFSAKTNPKGSNGQKIGDYYLTFMDSLKRNSLGSAPLKPFLTDIQNIKNNNEIPGVIAKLQMNGANILWGVYVGSDPKSSMENIAQMGQGGLGLPDKDYYYRKDEESKKLQQEYINHIATMLEYLGDNETASKENSKLIYEFEYILASASMNNVEQRDIEKQYNKFSTEELNKKFPAIEFKNYLKNIGLANAKNVIVGQPKFFATADSLIKTAPVNTWKQYMRWCLINSFADQLSDDIAQSNFAFFGTQLTGQKVMKPRWKRALAEIDQIMGEALGQLFVERHFSADSKKKVNEIVDNLMIAYKERINTLDWMSNTTKIQAEQKLNTIIRKLGYPDKWRDYSNLNISRNSYFENYQNAVKFLINYNYSKLGKPVDRNEWFMSPPTVNAYYNPTTNEITFPAGIMQPPFFFSDADDAINYAAIGAVIGHELTHGFDDQGSQFDKDGNMKDWWTEEDKNKFTGKTKMVVDQFNNYVAIDTLKVNGELTLGENIADLGGISIAYAAFKKTAQFKENKEIDGFSPTQRFFISWAQIWRTNYTNAALKRQVNTNPHSPSMFRANGPLSNMVEFYEAFGVKEGDKMWRPENQRAKIW